MAEYKGARWWRCDLHVHTPFDGRRFGENLRDIQSAVEAGSAGPLQALAARFWAACDGIDVVGVTDHNTINGMRALAPHLTALSEEAAANGRHFPVFLPGVELTVGSERPMHFLVLFSAESDLDDIDRVIRGVFGANPTHNDRGEPLPSGRSVGDFLEGLKAYCNPDSGERRVPFVVVPAHVESSTGVAVETGARDTTGPDLLQQMRGILRERAITRASWHGFQTTNEFGRLQQALRDLLCVWEANRQDQRWDDLSNEEKAAIRSLQHWPLIEASDPDTYEHIGRRFSWLKMADPDLEGIRLALLDSESRLRRMAVGEPGTRHPHIRSISIRNTDFVDSIDVVLSPNLTTIIGGRGSGKSTLVEMLRYGLPRDQPADCDREEQETRGNIERLLRVKGVRDWGRSAGVLLHESEVEVRFVVGGVEYVAKRTPAAFSVTRQDGATLPGDQALDVRSLIKPQILSQGQISRIARDPAAQRREIDRVASDDPGISGFARERSLLTARLESLQSDLRGAGEDEARVSPTLTELQTVRDQLDVLERGPTREIMQQYAALQREARLLGEWKQAIAMAAASLREAAAELAEHASAVAPGQDVSAFVTQEADRAKQALEDAAGSSSETAARLAAFEREGDERRNAEWEPQERQIGLEYSNLMEELRAQGISADQHASLVAQRSRLEQQLSALQQSSARQAGLIGEIDDLWLSLDSVHTARSTARRAVGEMLSAQDADIRLNIVPYGDRESLETRREAWFAGTNLHASDWEVLLDWVFSEENGIHLRWRQLVEAMSADRELARESEISEGRELRRLLGERSQHLSGHLWRAIPRMDLARLEEMFRTLPEDRVEASVRDPDGDFKPIEQGSLGQRSTAIVSLIMSAGDQPLVIDQPEEDLDNQYVYTAVVGLLRKQKFRRQLVLATHNANIPVNGDAELIIAMKVDEKTGVIGSEGSIDQSEIKDDVNAILEGSAEAFRLRRRRYGY